MRHRPHLPLAWFIRSSDPYNRLGKQALQDIYSWRDRGRVLVDIVYGPRPTEDVVVVRRNIYPVVTFGHIDPIRMDI